MIRLRPFALVVGIAVVAVVGCDRTQSTDCPALLDKIEALGADDRGNGEDGGASVEWKAPMIESCRETDSLETYAETVECAMTASTKQELESCPKYREMTRAWARAMAKRRFQNVKFRGDNDGG